jgi:hypothetical protein
MHVMLALLELCTENRKILNFFGKIQGFYCTISFLNKEKYLMKIFIQGSIEKDIGNKYTIFPKIVSSKNTLVI